MEITDRIFNEAFMHEINVIRNRENFTARGIEVVHEIERRFEPMFKTAIANLSMVDIERLRNGRFTGTRALDRINELVQRMTAEIALAIQAFSTGELIDAAQYETMFWGDRFNQFFESDELAPLRQEVSMPDGRQTRGVPLSVAVTGITLVAGFRQYRQSRRARLRTGIATAAQDGHVGLSRLFTVTRAQRRQMRVFGESAAGLAMRLRGLHLGTVSTAARRFVDENEKLDLVWTAQTEPGRPGIDSRTTAICIGLNGQLVNRDLDGRVPPAHIGCRSAVYPTIDYRTLTRSQRRSLTRETSMALRRGLPSEESSTAAFNRLSTAEQMELLGPTRFLLFQEGGVQFPSGFINARDTRKFTIDEIARREGIDISELRRSA